MGAQPAAAAPVPGDTPGPKTDLVGAASTFGEQTTMMFLMNTGPSALRAIVTVRDGDDVLGRSPLAGFRLCLPLL